MGLNTVVSCSLSYSTLRSQEHGKLLINLSAALIGLYISFVFGGLVQRVPALCGIVAALIQYFTLAFFAWAAVEAVNLYRNLVIVIGGPTITHFVLKAALIAWGK